MTNEVFINYRTGDGERIAALLERELSHRFGSEHIFRASKSIEPGTAFPRALITAVRRCSVLLAVIGDGWSRRPELRNEEDWVRREILEAFECAIDVIPVLEGRKTERLNREHLPEPLRRLADVQSETLDLSKLESDVARIGDLLAAKVPELKAADRSAPHETPAQSSGNWAGNANRTVIQNRDGSINIGGGTHQHHSPQVSGPGASYVAGDNHGGIRHTFGGADGKGEDGS
jgi:hypothetical protein